MRLFEFEGLVTYHSRALNFHQDLILLIDHKILQQYNLTRVRLNIIHVGDVENSQQFDNLGSPKK